MSIEAIWPYIEKIGVLVGIITAPVILYYAVRLDGHFMHLLSNNIPSNPATVRHRHISLGNWRAISVGALALLLMSWPIYYVITTPTIGPQGPPGAPGPIGLSGPPGPQAAVDPHIAQLSEVIIALTKIQWFTDQSAQFDIIAAKYPEEKAFMLQGFSNDGAKYPLPVRRFNPYVINSPSQLITDFAKRCWAWR